ncbi:MAG TPA: VOC family protein [Bacillota bacterium]|nr:VOC family protein [Bacillota bacterium]HPF42611.1 VOC family protein [Bacillota bacterium]HPJ86236.1 VOC family protein [Bacillota bacterium]HPQ62274.1 VOC family protein [Bacillota bacterium]HRX92295.1 VOC family protein [Candidatus Izemoplasmatales bacterium]
MDAKEVVVMIKEDIRIGMVGIPVADPIKESEFYRNLFGLSETLENAANHPLRFLKTDFTEEKTFEHLALKVRSRAELGRILRRLINLQIPILGAIDHGYAESIYLNDPEKNVIEIASLRDAQEWYDEFGQIKDSSSPFDYSGVYYAAEAEDAIDDSGISVAICHIVLNVPDLDKARHFYEQAMGFAVRSEKKGKALLLTASQCHHQIGLAATKKISKASAVFSISYPVCESLMQTIERIRGKGFLVNESEKGYLVTDPFGNMIYLVLG